jgi:membrane-associated phospholipid phosphatase
MARGHGIPRSGDAWDSFPSGHAVHIGALAGPLLRAAPSKARPFLGAGLAGLAATRVLLLAHYGSDVLAGLLLGAGISAAVRRFIRPGANCHMPGELNRNAGGSTRNGSQGGVGEKQVTR